MDDSKPLPCPLPPPCIRVLPPQKILRGTSAILGTGDIGHHCGAGAVLDLQTEIERGWHSQVSRQHVSERREFNNVYLEPGREFIVFMIAHLKQGKESMGVMHSHFGKGRESMELENDHTS